MMPISAGSHRREVLIALFCTSLVIGGNLLYQPVRTRILRCLPSVDGSVSIHAPARASPPTWHTALLMIFVLTRALFEYARLVLLLLCHQEAARTCYQKKCSPIQMLTELEQANAKQGHRGGFEEEDEVGSSRASEVPLQSDHISTNILLPTPQLEASTLITPLQRSRSGDCDTRSICGCEEEDYAVALEDDIRKPGATPHPIRPLEPDAKYHGEFSKVEVVEPVQESRASARAHSQEEAGHHLEEVLLPTT